MSKEQIYDAKISPLMTQIIAICKEHKIAALAAFSIPTEEDDGLTCTTALLSDDFDPPQRFIDAARNIAGRREPLFVTTRDANGNVTRMDAIL